MRTTKAQTSLISAFVIRFLKNINSKLHIRKIFIVYIVSVAEQTGLTNPEDGFFRSRPKPYKKDNCGLVHNTCNSLVLLHIIAVKSVLSGHSKRPKIGFE